MRSNESSAAHTPSRTGAREAEGSGLLSRPAGHRRVGSNPTPSASEPERFSGASGQREVDPTGNEGRRSGSDQAAATVDHMERLREYAKWGGKDSTYQWALDEIERLQAARDACLDVVHALRVERDA